MTSDNLDNPRFTLKFLRPVANFDNSAGSCVVSAVKGERNIVAVEENNILYIHGKVNVMEHFPVEKTAENSVSFS